MMLSSGNLGKMRNEDIWTSGFHGEMQQGYPNYL